MVVLDLDGTILDIREHHHACYAAILDEAGYAALPRSRYWSLKRQGVGRTEILAKTGAESFDGEFLQTWLDRIESRAYLDLDEVLPSARAVLDRWVAEGRPPMLVTARRNEATLRWQLDHLGLAGCFTDVVRAEHGQGRWFKGAALRTRHPNTAIEAWIGDSEDDLHAASHLGAAMIAVTTGLRDRPFLEGLGADVIFDDLGAAADHVGHGRRR